MARTDPTSHGDVADVDGGAVAASEEDQAIAEDMLSEFGPAFRRLAEL